MIENIYRALLSIEGIYLVLFTGILYQGVRQKTAQRKFCAYFLLTCILIFKYIDPYISTALGFYVGAALVNLLFVIVTSQLNPIPSILPRLHLMCLAAVYLNGFGYWLWYQYYEPFLYDISFIVIYLYTIMLFSTRDPIDESGTNSSNLVFRFNLNQVFLCLPKRKGKI